MKVDCRFGPAAFLFGLQRHGLARFHHGRGGFGRGFGPFGPGGSGRPFGPPGQGQRFERGDLKYVMLDLLQSGPRHGYDIIRALEERFHGFYSPSPGSVYPALQLLEDQGYVTSSQQDGKRIYSITEEGRRFLAERASKVDAIRARMAAGWGTKASPELRSLMDEVRQIGQFLFGQAAHGALADADKIRRLREVVARAHRDIESIFRGDPGPSGPYETL